MLYSIICIFTFAFISNIFCGFLRESSPKFSFKWFFWIHASVPFIIYLRISFHISSWFIPVTIFIAVLGQIVGARLKKKKMSLSEKEALLRITDLKIKSTHNLSVDDTLVALLNMGGPRSLSDVPAFQKCLFNDRLLIKFPGGAFLQKIFASILIRFRTQAVCKLYQIMGGKSPIYKSTTAQARALRKELKARGINVDVTFSFNYSPPFPEQTIQKAIKHHKKNILALSLYPHYSRATTGSNVHYLKKAAEQYGDEGIKVYESSSYYLHPGYIQAFVDRIHESINQDQSLDDFYLVFSAHGLPLYFLTEGDPYPFQISQTVGAILGQLNRSDNWTISYQSAVGPLQWIKPSTEDMIKTLIQKGIKKIIVVPVAFVGDHIETTVEIDDEYRHLAQEMGVEDFRMTKALETHSGLIEALADTVEKQIQNSKYENLNKSETVNNKHAILR